MFKIHRQPPGEGAVKKSIQKLVDPKKDVVTRLKHLKNVIDNSTDNEVQALFETNYSHIYYIFYENFLLAETNLRQKGSHRAQREELDAILVIFEQILINLPELIHQRWQYHSIDNIIKRLLHSQNSLKVRREGLHFFLLWLRALQENALPRTLLLYACLIPGFPPPTFSDGKPYSLEWLVNMPINEEYGVHPVEITCLVPPSSGEKSPNDHTKYFLDALLEFMVLKSRVLRWKDKSKMTTKSFSFLWDLFKENYLPHAFPEFNLDTNIYSSNLILPEPRESVNYILNVSDSGSIDPRIEVASGCAMLPARVSIIKWIVAFTGTFERQSTLVMRPDSKIEALQRQVLKQLQELYLSNSEKSADVEVKPSLVSSANTLPQHVQSLDTNASNSNTSTLTEKEPSISSLSSLDDKLRSSAATEEELVRNVLYSTRQNINIVHELFRQAFMLPLTEVPTMRRVVKVYQEWIQDNDLPIFMEDESEEEDEDAMLNRDESDSKQPLQSSASLRNVSYMRGQLHPVINDALSTRVRAGSQGTLQLFITNSAHVFLVEPPSNAAKLTQAQVDVCKRVLNIYRYLVMNVFLSDVTWRQLLRVLLHITRVMLQEQDEDDEPDIFKPPSSARKLASPVFQTLIVSWIKANLFVHVSRELWDELVDVLSSLTHWLELIIEWNKNMETMTRVLSRHVYKLELLDLPLDRLTEQKHKKQKKSDNSAKSYSSNLQSSIERSFSRGWSRDSIPSTSANLEAAESRRRSHSAYLPRMTSTEESPLSSINGNTVHDKPPYAENITAETSRHRSSTIPISVTEVSSYGNALSSGKGVSKSNFLTSPNDFTENNTVLKRHSSASDINLMGKECPPSTSPTRHRCDSEGQPTDRCHPPHHDSNGPHVAWQEPTHEILSYQSGSIGASESISVNSLEAEEDMFDQLIHERLHSNYKDQKPKELWPNEATSLHSTDSASIDPDWNPWADPLVQSLPDGDTQSADSRSAEFASFDNAFDVIKHDTVSTSGALNFSQSVGIPVPSANSAAEDATVDYSDTAEVSPPNFPILPPLSQTPPAIPARRALPPPSSLSGLDFLTPTPDVVMDFAIPSYNNSDAATPSPDPPQTQSPIAVNVISSTPQPVTPTQAPSFTYVTNHAQNNSDSRDKDEDLLSDSMGSLLKSPPYQLHQNVSNEKDDSSTLLLHEDQPAESSFLESASSSEFSKAIKADDVISLNVCDADINDPNTQEQEKQEEDMLSASTEDILLQACSTPHIAKPPTEQEDEEKLNDSFTTVELRKGIKTDLNAQSIMAGGKLTGWYPDVAVALWRRLLGILGDVNEISDGEIHQRVFYHLNQLWDILFKMRQNIGVANDSQPAQDNEVLVSPLRMLAPWGFKAAMSLPESHKGGKLCAYQLLCKMTVQREHDIPLEPEHLAQFYAVLHDSLHCADQDIVNEIIGSCSQYFAYCLPASTILLLDFLYACHTVAASPDLKAPRVEAQTILGSTLCFPNLYNDIPVLKPDSVEPTATICNNVKDYVVEALLTSGKKEPSAAARCIALSSTGLWLYEELTCRHQRHSRVKEAINVLLVSLKFSNRTVASVACTQLHLLTYCSSEIMSTMPDMPSRIIEVMSLTVSALLNSTEAKNTESGRQLIVALLLCIMDWCMALPLDLLVETTGPQSDKRLIRTVFKALQTAALGKPGHSAKHSYSLSDLASQDFDPNLPLDKVQETSNNVITSLTKPSLSRTTVKLGKDGAVSLAAHTVLNHLTNHLGHFPLARGTSVLTCRVSEHHDVIDAPDELSASLFHSPDVQFLIYNDTCLLSVVEIPAEDDKPGGGPTAGMSTSNRCVRFIVRDAGGKYCWDSSVLYGPPDIKDATLPVQCQPLSTLDAEISRAAKESCQSYIAYADEEKGRKRKVASAPLPHHEHPPLDDSPDKLDQLLQYMAFSSPECQTRIGHPLNAPALVPVAIGDDLQLEVISCMLRHHSNLGASYEANARVSSWQCNAMRPRQTVDSHSSFYHARLLCAEMGFLSRENRHRVNLLTKDERLLRELKNLDARRCRETHKVAVLYIAEGQEEKLPVLSNTGGSKEYEDFVAGLGWEVDLSTHSGFRGKLQSDGSTGRTAPYYATSTLEVVFHVATRFPSTDDDARNVKLKHLGNDEVHIVWSEHYRDYRRGIIPTEFGDVVIVIYPLRHGLYRIQILKKPDVPYFGPLFDGAVVNARVLPVLVRETAINAGRAKRSQISLYQPFYEERTRYLRQIIERFKDERTFEDYCAHLFCPVPQGRRGRREASPKDPGLPSTPIPSGSASSNSLNTNNNHNLASVDSSHQSLFRDTTKRVQNLSVFTSPSTGIQEQYASTAPTPTYLSPHVPTKPRLTSSLSNPLRLSPVDGPPSSFSFPVPHNPTLSSSAPGTSRTPQQFFGHRPHRSGRTDVSGRNLAGGSQPQLNTLRDFPDISEFPTPPESPPSRLDLPHEI
ncbi:ral GTPase-activating protein subunit alpha-1-like isoform X2 [Clavelina lepadiformis]|uniref:ral GTPase-activating protein subunit alpha-1-like isoform X2 n=1 Tax=Clavelina lepadiformis TaxID=159417 RepID=UPI00404391A3